MLMSFLKSLFGGRKPTRIYVVTGEPLKPFTEPRYITDPRHYGLPLFKRPVSDDEFERKYRHGIKAFIKRYDAITFAYHCNLDSVACPVYDRVGDKWVYNPDETGKVADQIN
jgi:hypothetical protein